MLSFSQSHFQMHQQFYVHPLDYLLKLFPKHHRFVVTVCLCQREGCSSSRSAALLCLREHLCEE